MQEAIKQWQVSERWLKIWPDAFDVVYENKTEETLVARLKKDDRFLKSYALYLEAMNRLNANQNIEARRLLQEARLADPQLLAALNAEGTNAWRLDHDANTAIRCFQKALHIRRDYPLAWLNLARIYKAQGDSVTSQGCYRRAASAVAVLGEYPFLLDQIQQEMMGEKEFAN